MSSATPPSPLSVLLRIFTPSPVEFPQEDYDGIEFRYGRFVFRPRCPYFIYVSTNKYVANSPQQCSSPRASSYPSSSSTCPCISTGRLPTGAPLRNGSESIATYTLLNFPNQETNI